MSTAHTDDLRDSKGRKLPWGRTAASALEMLTASGEKPTPRASALKELSELSGYSIPILLRQVALLRFVDTVATELGVEASALRDRPFSVLELASTLYKRERAAGLSALRDVLSGKAEVKSLRNKIDELSKEEDDPAGPEDAARERHDRHKRILEILKSGRPGLEPRPRDWGGGEARRRGFAHPPVCRFTWWCRTDSFEWGPNLLEGFDLLYAPSGSTSKWLEDRIARTLASAAFFDLFWIVLAEPTHYLDRIKAALSLPRRSEIGIVAINRDGSVSALREAKRRDRSAEERELIRDFAPDKDPRTPTSR